MPTYEYKCRACGNTFERFHRMTADPVRCVPTAVAKLGDSSVAVQVSCQKDRTLARALPPDVPPADAHSRAAAEIPRAITAPANPEERRERCLKPNMGPEAKA